MFRLLRYFSVTSIVAFALVAVLLATMYRQFLVDRVIEQGGAANAALSRSMANALWPRFSDHLGAMGSLDGEAIRAHPGTARLREAVLAQVRGLSVVKVKIYNTDGLTVFSTQPGQIGDDKRNNAGFQAAIAGQVASELTHRNTFSTLHGTIMDRDVLSSYVPIVDDSGQPRGVFEIYDDLTPILQRIRASELHSVGGSVAILAALFLILFLIVRRAERIMVAQHAKIVRHEQDLLAKNTELEHEIAERMRQAGEIQALNDGLNQRIAELQEVKKQLERQGEEVKANAASMAQLRDQAEAANRAKSEFLANMSHELRTPLNAIMGFAEIIKDGMLGPVGNDAYPAYGKDIYESGEHLVSLVNDILDLSKIESRQIEMIEEDIDLSYLAKSCLRFVKERALRHGITLDLQVPDDLPLLHADDRRMKQVLVNLLSNAIKFTPDGGRVELLAERLADRRLRISVADTGVGIAPEDRAKVFQPFQQADNQVARSNEGTGLGLAVTKAIVETLGGEIVLDSAVGKGTRIDLLFPAERTKDRTALLFGTA